jgi:HSP20 family molecular chaperone IbpA
LILMDKEERDKKENTDITKLLNIEILGLNLGDLVKKWVGEPETLLDPEKHVEVKRRIEESRAQFEKLKDELQSRSRGAVKVDYNISIRTLDGGEVRLGSVRTPTRTIKPDIEAEKAREQEIKEPLYEIFDRGDHIEVLTEVPGVEEKDLKTDITEESLTLETIEGAARKYKLEIELPVKIVKEDINKKLKNGVLTIALKKQVSP